jgi:maltoporin
MKKCLFIAVAIVFISSTIRAQETHFGLKAGLNSSSVKISNGGEDYDSKTGFHVGGLAHIHIARHFAVQPEILYSTQGGKNGDDFKLKLNYINVPVLAQYMFDEGFRLQTGPQIGFLTTAKTKEGDLEEDVKDDLESIDFSWAFGASYLFPQGLGIDARYNLGISNISESDVFEAKNRVFQVGLFYQFMHAKGK